MKLKLSINPTSLIRILLRYQLILAIVVFLGVIGFTAYQVSQIYGVEPDKAYLEAQKNDNSGVRIQSGSKTLKQLRQLQTNTVSPHSARDPFQP